MARNYEKNQWLLGAAAVGLVAASAQTSNARVVSFDIEKQAAAYDGKAFGDAGAYERIDAVAHLAIDPKSERGKRMRFSTRHRSTTRARSNSRPGSRSSPRRISRGSGTLFYEVANRGRNLAFPLLNLTSAPASTFSIDDPGDGYLMSRGYTIVWSGWQADIGNDLIQMKLP